MTGTPTNTVISSYVAETTAGTTPATPSFTTLSDPVLLTATPELVEQNTLQAGGARSDVAVAKMLVSGTMSGNLVYGNMDAILASLLQGAWASNVLKDGKTTSTMTFENAIPKGAGASGKVYYRYRGVQATGGSITLSSGANVEYSLDLSGIGSDDGVATAITGATYSDPSNQTPLVSGLDVGTIAISGFTLDCIQSAKIDFAFDGRDPQERLGSYDLCGITPGAFRPVISIRFYIEANAKNIYNAARAAQTPFSVTFPIGSVSGSKYTIEFPTCVFSKADTDLSANEVMLDAEIMPLYDDTTENAVVKITRAIT